MDKVMSARAMARAAERAEMKAANARIRAENQREKQARRLHQRGDGMFRKPLHEARRLHAGDPLKQLEFLFDSGAIPAAVGRQRLLGLKRTQDLKESMRSFIQMLPNLRHGIQNLDELSIKQVVALIRAWQHTGIAASTIQGYISILRRFFCLMGKAKVLPPGKQLEERLIERGLQLEGRCYIPDFQKGWRDLGHDIADIVRRIRDAGHEVIAIQLEMMYAFGLRTAESMGIRPRESEQETGGTGLAITRNTKGGKHRVVYFFQRDLEFARYQRDVLERAKALADLHPAKILAIPGLTLKQMKNRFRWVMRKFGIDKKGLGITPHGLRHQFACDLFRDVSGLPAPVLGLLDAAEYRKSADLVEKASLEVSKQLGHERKHVSGSYTGSVGQLGRSQRKRLDGWVGQLIQAGSAFRAADVREAWLVDTCGRGGVLRPGEPMRLAVRLDDDLSLKAALDRMETLRVELEGVTAMKVALQPWQATGLPHDAAEILFEEA